MSVGSAQANATVLVVEDEELLRLGVAKMLRKEGFIVVEAADGAAAAELLLDSRRKIDLILLDMTMPGMPSSTVVTEASRLRPNAKLLLTSAHGREMLRPVADTAQVAGFVRKPFQLRELVAVIRQALSL
jgi:DNA-binding response OmpR family regulator